METRNEILKNLCESITSPLKAIKEQCLQCVGTIHMVKTCTEKNKCTLWNFRLGKNPFRKPMSEERKEEIRKRFKIKNIPK